MDAQLTGASAKQITAHADEIANIQQLVKLEGFFADGIFLDVNLQLLAVLLHVHESSFAHRANGHYAAGDRNVYAVTLKVFGGAAFILLPDFRNGHCRFVPIGIGWLAKGFNLRQLFAPLLIDFFVECQGFFRIVR